MVPGRTTKKHARGKYKGGVGWVVHITHRVAAPRRDAIGIVRLALSAASGIKKAMDDVWPAGGDGQKRGEVIN